MTRDKNYSDSCDLNMSESTTAPSEAGSETKPHRQPIVSLFDVGSELTAQLSLYEGDTSKRSTSTSISDTQDSHVVASELTEEFLAVTEIGESAPHFDGLKGLQCCSCRTSFEGRDAQVRSTQ